jgi:hypothetical protein
MCNAGVIVSHKKKARAFYDNVTFPIDFCRSQCTRFKTKAPHAMPGLALAQLSMSACVSCV